MTILPLPYSTISQVKYHRAAGRTQCLIILKLPPYCTDRLQPMDLTVNKAAKDFLKQKFSEWYSQQVAVQLGDNIDFDNLQVQPVNLSMAAVKHAGTRWLDEMYTVNSV